MAPGTLGKFGLFPATFLPGTVIYADSSAGSTGPQLLYQAIGAGNLRAYVRVRTTWGTRRWPTDRRADTPTAR